MGCCLAAWWEEKRDDARRNMETGGGIRAGAERRSWRRGGRRGESQMGRVERRIKQCTDYDGSSFGGRSEQRKERRTMEENLRDASAIKLASSLGDGHAHGKLVH